jgi:hypothetical protein
MLNVDVQCSQKCHEKSVRKRFTVGFKNLKRDVSLIRKAKCLIKIRGHQGCLESVLPACLLSEALIACRKHPVLMSAKSHLILSYLPYMRANDNLTVYTTSPYSTRIKQTIRPEHIWGGPYHTHISALTRDLLII